MTWSRLLHNPLEFLSEGLKTRGVRLCIYALVVAALFPSSRFLVVLVLGTALAVVWGRDYAREKSRKIFYLAAAALLLIIGYAPARMNVKSVDEQRITKSLLGSGIELVRDGTYRGSGEGFRGPIQVEVKVEDHRITDLKMLEYPDLISVKDNEIARYRREILAEGRLERPSEPGMFRGAIPTFTGYVNAIEAALSKGVPDYPRYGVYSRAFFGAFIGSAPSRVTLNALAILFAAFLVFEYALQSMITPGTGRSINCYNCATCVGACPIKEVEGVPFPMGLVLLTRLGDYDRVVELSKYCVGCSRCATKCPIGNSGPMIIAAAFQASRLEKKKKAEQAAEEGASA
jgi:uncharacterized protein with FMN-binding domain/ferredoxin